MSRLFVFFETSKLKEKSVICVYNSTQFANLHYLNENFAVIVKMILSST